MRENEGAKPFPEDASLSGHSVQFSWKTIGAYRCDGLGGHKLGLLKPSDKVVSVCQPFDHRVDWRAN
jgi:hypothetical protein